MAFLSAYGTPFLIAALSFLIWRARPSGSTTVAVIASVFGVLGACAYLYTPQWSPSSADAAKAYLIVSASLSFGAFVAVAALVLHFWRAATQQGVPADVARPAGERRG